MDKKIDYCVCRACGTEVFVDMDSQCCPSCGSDGCLDVIEKQVDQEELVERLQSEGWDWYDHMLDVYAHCSRLDPYCLDEIGAMWENLETDEWNIRNIEENYRKGIPFYE